MPPVSGAGDRPSRDTRRVPDEAAPTWGTDGSMPPIPGADGRPVGDPLVVGRVPEKAATAYVTHGFVLPVTGLVDRPIRAARGERGEGRPRGHDRAVSDPFLLITRRVAHRDRQTRT